MKMDASTQQVFVHMLAPLLELEPPLGFQLEPRFVVTSAVSDQNDSKLS